MPLYPDAIITLGPEWKQGYPDLIGQQNSRNGVVLHSAQGSLAGTLGELNGPATKSWHFTIDQDGTVYQHYDTLAICWHSGNKGAHQWLVAIEHIGGPPGNLSEPLTPQQLLASVALVHWLGNDGGWTPQREEPGRTLKEHNELFATACPSGRIPWSAYLLPASNPEHLTKEEFIALYVKLFLSFDMPPLRFEKGTTSFNADGSQSIEYKVWGR